MSKQLPSIDTNADTFYSWTVKYNGIVNFANSEVVTANTSGNGAVTIGKGFVVGSFGSNTLVCTTITAGNTTAVANTLTITSNTDFGGSVRSSDFYGPNNSSRTATTVYSVSNTSQQVIDTFSSSQYRSAKYVISVTDPVNSKFQCTEILFLHDGTTTYSTEYATLLSNTSLASFTNDVNAGNVRVLATPAVANLQIKIHKTLLAI